MGWVSGWVEKMNDCYDVIMMSLQKKENRVIEIWYIMGRKIEFKMQNFYGIDDLFIWLYLFFKNNNNNNNI